MLRSLHSRIVVTAIAFAGLCSPAIAEVAPPDPAHAGEWLAFCSIQLPKDLSAEAKAACKATLGSLLTNAAAWIYPANSAEFGRITATVSEAIDGKAVAIWLLPPSNNEPGPITLTTLDKVPSKPHDSLVSPASAEWTAHRAKSASAHPSPPGALPAIELAINLNAARRQFGPAFDPLAEGTSGGRAARLLEALHLSNARIAGLHVRLLPPASVKTRDPSLPRVADAADSAYAGPMLAMVEATWTARSEPPGKVYLVPLTTEYWPLSQVGQPMPGTVVAAAVRVPWRTHLVSALQVYGALLPTAEATKFDRQSAGWMDDKKSAVTRLVSTLDPWVQVGLSTEQRGEYRVAASLRPDASAPATAAAFDSFVGSLPGGLKPAGGSPSPWRWEANGGENWWIRRVEWNLTERKAPERSTLNASVSIPLRAPQ